MYQREFAVSFTVSLPGKPAWTSTSSVEEPFIKKAEPAQWPKFILVKSKKKKKQLFAGLSLPDGATSLTSLWNWPVVRKARN